MAASLSGLIAGNNRFYALRCSTKIAQQGFDGGGGAFHLFAVMAPRHKLHALNRPARPVLTVKRV